jgi:hypothetical protein
MLGITNGDHTRQAADHLDAVVIAPLRELLCHAALDRSRFIGYCTFLFLFSPPRVYLSAYVLMIARESAGDAALA